MRHLRARAAVAAALLLAAAAAPAADTVWDHPATAAQLERDLAAVAGTLRAARTLRGDYVQHKTLREVPRPLVAEGSYLFVRGVGIVWRTVKPFASSLAITPDGAVSRDASGAVLRLDSTDQPALRTVAGLFFAIFALDFAALEPLFVLHSRQSAGRWELGLQPRAAAGGVRDVVVSGRRNVERVVLRDAGGDLTDIRFGAPRASSAPATAADRAEFTLP